MRVVCFGPGPKFKVGISNYNTSLARALDRLPGTEVHIVSWTQQYPAIIPREFVDKSSKQDLLEGTNIQVQYLTNYNNPFSWYATYKYILSLKPDVVVFQWAIAIQGLPIGQIIRWLRRHPEIEVVADLHFVVQKENSTIDRFFYQNGDQKGPNLHRSRPENIPGTKNPFPKKAIGTQPGRTKVYSRDNGASAVPPDLRLVQARSEL